MVFPLYAIYGWARVNRRIILKEVGKELYTRSMNAWFQPSKRSNYPFNRKLHFPCLIKSSPSVTLRDPVKTMERFLYRGFEQMVRLFPLVLRVIGIYPWEAQEHLALIFTS